jgi:small-conductance mechanosensitive channel
MRKFSTLILLLTLAYPAIAMAQAGGAAGTPPVAQPANPARPAASLAPNQAQQALDVLRDDRRRGELISTLEAIVKIAPASPAAAGTTPSGTVGPHAAPTAAGAPAAAPAADTKSVLPIEPDSLGVQLFLQVSTAVADAGTQLVASIRAVNDLPLLWRWVSAQASDPEALARILDAGWKLLVAFGAALAAEWIGRLVLRRVRTALSRGAHATPVPPSQPVDPVESALAAAEAGESERSARQRRLTGALSALRRLPFLVGRLMLDVVPIALFALVGYLLMGTTLGQPAITRQVIVAVVQAYVVGRLALAVTAMLVSPASPRLRLLHVSDWAADFITRWLRRLVIIGLAGYCVAEVGLLFGMYRTAYEALLKVVALVVHVCLVVAVLQAREPVARRLRARHAARGMWVSALNRLSEVWHLIAIFYIMALWLVWAVELRNGYLRLINFFLITAGVLVAARVIAVVLLGGFDRLRIGPDTAARHPGLEARLNAYYPFIRGVLLLAIGVATGFALLEAWGFAVIGWFENTGLGSRSVSAITLILVTVVLAVLVWEGANAGIELHLARLTQAAQLARAGRLRTLLPMLRTVLLVTIVLVVALMVLSEVGVNIAPLLAGAGVIGIAVGFGSQKLVQDLITGLFLLLENAMQVGDVVTLGGLTGTVEALSIRTIRLRAGDGAVHIIPFSAVTTVTNQTRDYSYAVLELSIGLNEEPDRVSAVLKEVAETMRADTKWANILLDRLDVQGVDKFVDTAWVMRARIKTQPASRWAVGRELNRRIKHKFDELGIESLFTSHRALSTVPEAPGSEGVPA